MDSALLASERHDWQTPELVLELVRKLGPILLDPCTTDDNPCGAVARYVTQGLDLGWSCWADTGQSGLVFVNPPYGRQLGAWVEKATSEAVYGVEIVLLTPCRPDTRWYDHARSTCNAYCEIRGRLTFKGAPHPAPFPSALHYWGPKPWLFAHVFSVLGRVGVRS